jgi:hypothetical protein
LNKREPHPESYFKYGFYLDFSDETLNNLNKKCEVVVAGKHCLDSLCHVGELIKKLEKFKEKNLIFGR